LKKKSPPAFTFSLPPHTPRSNFPGFLKHWLTANKSSPTLLFWKRGRQHPLMGPHTGFLGGCVGFFSRPRNRRPAFLKLPFPFGGRGQKLFSCSSHVCVDRGETLFLFLIGSKTIYVPPPLSSPPICFLWEKDIPPHTQTPLTVCFG